MRRAVIAPLASSTIPDELAKRWIGALGDAGVRRDLARFSRGVSSKCTLDAASRFVNFEKPVLIAWGTRDRFFPLVEAQRLAAAFPEARRERIENAKTFVQFDAPERLGELILETATAQIARA